jgi:hypothetical protein
VCPWRQRIDASRLQLAQVSQVMGNNVVIVSVVSFRKLLEIAIYKDTRYAV